MSGDEAAAPVVPPVAEPAAIPQDMDLLTALELTLRKARAYGGGLHESAKLIEKRVVQLCVLAEDKKQLETSIDDSISASGALFVYLITGFFLAAGFWVVRNIYSVDLISDPSLTLRLLWIIEFPVVVIIYSLFRRNPEKCSYFRAVGRSILGLISGALINALGAVALGAPIGLQSLPKTIHLSFLMSVFTIVPATAVFGASWTNWHRMFASLKPSGNIEYMMLIPAYGAIIGGWFGAWPMPLDWERPWQEWPVCVCYGAIGGHIVGKILSLSLMLFLRKHKNLKLA